VNLAQEAARILKAVERTVWLVIGGGFSIRPFVRPLMAAGIMVMERLCKGSALRDLPSVVMKK